LHSLLVLWEVQVDGEDVAIDLKGILAKWGETETVKALPLQTLIDEAHAIFKQIADFQANTSTWKVPFTYEQERVTLLAIDDAVKRGLKSLQRYMTVFTGLEKTVAAETAKKEKDYKDVRDSISRALRAGTVPAAIAKVLADFMTMVEEKRAVGLVDVAEHPTKDSMNGCILVRFCDAPAPDAVWVKANTSFHFKNNLDLAEAKVVEKIPMMKEKPCYHYHCTLDGSKPYQWNALAGNNPLFHAADVESVFHIARNIAFDVRSCAMPLARQRQCVTLMTGCALVVVAEPAQVLGMPDLQEGIASAHHTFFGVQQCVQMFPGDTLLLPLCHVPLIVGVPYDKAVSKAYVPGLKEKPVKDAVLTSHVSFLVSCAFDSRFDLSHSSEATSAALAAYSSAGAQIAKSIRANDCVQQWHTALQTRAA